MEYAIEVGEHIIFTEHSEHHGKTGMVIGLDEDNAYHWGDLYIIAINFSIPGNRSRAVLAREDQITRIN